MQTVTDTAPDGKDIEILRPFGPTIIKKTMPQDVQDFLCNIFENHERAEDYNHTLAGNQKREFEITGDLLGEQNSNKFVDMLGDGAGELYRISRYVQWENIRDSVTDKHRNFVDDNLKMMNLSVAVHSSWGNIGIAGDWNPVHRHTGAMSGVGYLRLPDDIETEWANEDHEPSAGMINFVDSRPADLVSHNCRRKPQVGDIYFFPSWLLHEVMPFRSGGERWSFSFNVTVENLNDDIQLNEWQKQEIINGKS